MYSMPYLENLMTGLNDTDRLAVMNPTFDDDHPYLKATQRVDLSSYREIQFIIAETATGDEQHKAYLNAIKVSFEELVKMMIESDVILAKREQVLLKENLIKPTWEHPKT